jgi:hypothetical protein
MTMNWSLGIGSSEKAVAELRRTNGNATLVRSAMRGAFVIFSNLPVRTRVGTTNGG